MMDIKESIGRLDARASHMEDDLRAMRTDLGSMRSVVGGMTDRKTFWWGVATIAGLMVAITTLLWNITEGFGSRRPPSPATSASAISPPEPPSPLRQPARPGPPSR